MFSPSTTFISVRQMLCTHETCVQRLAKRPPGIVGQFKYRPVEFPRPRADDSSSVCFTFSETRQFLGAAAQNRNPNACKDGSPLFGTKNARLPCVLSIRIINKSFCRLSLTGASAPDAGGLYGSGEKKNRYCTRVFARFETDYFCFLFLRGGKHAPHPFGPSQCPGGA